MPNIPFGTPGVAGDEFDSFRQASLQLSDRPAFLSKIMTLAASTTLSLYEVVGLNGAGEIVAADNGATVDAIGIMGGAATSGVGENPKVPVIVGGHFNGDKLVWDAAYDDDQKKQRAFDVAPQPTQIVVDFNKYNRLP